MLKNGTYSVPANVPPGRGTNRLKNGTSRQKRDGWQPYFGTFVAD